MEDVSCEVDGRQRVLSGNKQRERVNQLVCISVCGCGDNFIVLESCVHRLKNGRISQERNEQIVEIVWRFEEPPRFETNRSRTLVLAILWIEN